MKTTTLTQLKCLMLLIIVCSISFILLFIRSNLKTFTYVMRISDENIQYIRENDGAFAIETAGCNIPALRVYDAHVNRLLRKPRTYNPCPDGKTALLENNNTHIWTLKGNINYHYNIKREELLNVEDNLTCCYQAFYRPRFISDITSKAVDHRVEYKYCVVFNDIIDVDPTDEFVRVTCFYGRTKIYHKLFLFAPLKEFLSHEISPPVSKKKPSYNVLLIGADSISRLNFYRTMPKTLNYIKKLGAIELFGYNKVGDDTFANVIPLLLGIKHTALKQTCYVNKDATFDNCPFIWEWFKQAGFYTALGEDSSVHGIFNYMKSGFNGFPTDYYIHPFIRVAESYGNNFNRRYKRYLCLQERYFYEILLDYIVNLSVTMAFRRLFGFFWDVNLSHDGLNNAMELDDDYEKLFKQLNNSGYLNETIVFFLSDHGMRWGEILRTERGRLETRLPLMHIFVPESFRIKYRSAYNNLRLNSRRLTTPFDLHATLNDLVDLNVIRDLKLLSRSREPYSNNRGISLFLPMPLNRTCKMADIDDHWCTCHMSKEIAMTNDTNVLEATKYFMRHLNALLRPYTQCEKLKTEAIIEAREMFTAYENSTTIMVVVRASPGGGIFEATLRKHNWRWEVAGSVSRLNRYGSQSHCVDIQELKLYCYC